MNDGFVVFCKNSQGLEWAACGPNSSVVIDSVADIDGLPKVEAERVAAEIKMKDETVTMTFMTVAELRELLVAREVQEVFLSEAP